MSGRAKGGAGSVATVVADLAKPIAEELGYTLWDVRYVKEGAYYYLRIFIDKTGGITLDDCEKMSRAVNGPLDELDPVDQSYFLEVCSPGIERELTRPEHFSAMAGCKVCIRLFRPVDGCKEIVAELVELRDGKIVVKDGEGHEFEIERKNAVSVKLFYDPSEDDIDADFEDAEFDIQDGEAEMICDDGEFPAADSDSADDSVEG